MLLNRPRAARPTVRLAAWLTALGAVAGVSGCAALDEVDPSAAGTAAPTAAAPADPSGGPQAWLARLAALTVKGRAPRTGYERARFGTAWSDVDHNGCDTRDDVLARDLRQVGYRAGSDCVVVSGTLADPYTARTLTFRKAEASRVQIDHLVALSDAWQKGAAGWPAARRLAFANDPANLLAVDGPTNQAKGDGDAATWLPPNKAFRCTYVERQIAVKGRYALWVTPAEKDAMRRVLQSCPAAAGSAGAR